MTNQRLSTKWARIVTNNPYITIALSILLVVVMAYGARNTEISSDYRYFFGPDNPQRLAFDKLQNVYSQDDSVFITVAPKDGVVFKKDTLEALRYLTEQAWQLPFSTRVDSLTNFQYSYGNEDGLVVRDLIREEDLRTMAGSDGYESLRQIALNEPMLLDRLINPEASVTGVNVRMNFPGKSPFEVPDAAEAARNLAAQFAEQFPGHELHLTGMVMMNDAFNAAGIRDMMTLIPTMYLIITVVMYVMLRSVAAVGITLGVVFLSIVAGVGFAGWAGIPITPPSSISPTVIMTLAIANCIHILKSFIKLKGSGVRKQDAIVESMQINLRPVLLTSFTTMVGFLSLNFSDTPPFHDLGNITAAGVTVALLLSIALLPALVSVLSIRVKAGVAQRVDRVHKYTEWLRKNQAGIFLVTLFAIVFLGMQISKIKVNDQFVGYFDHSMEFRPASEFTIKHLTGIYFLHYDLSSGESQGIADPAYLQHIDEFSEYMRGVEGVVHVSTISDTFKRLSKNMHSDDESWYRLPENRELAAQYLLLYEMSLPYGLDLNTQINVDKSSSRVVVTLDDVPTSRILEISEQASEWLRDNTPQYMHVTGTSPTMMFSHITERNIDAMLWGTAIAFTLITIIMIISLGSMRYGFLSLLPNIIPATMAIGLWSILVGEAGFSIAFVASVTLGIIVDDTVHFLSKYTMARKEKNLDVDAAIHYALSHVGSALIATSIILVLGFSILMLSGFKLNFVLGALSALTIAIALIIDFTFLPAVLRMADNFKLGGVMKLKTITSTFAVALVAFGMSNLVNAKESDIEDVNKGLWVAQQIDNRDSGFINQTSDTKMLLANKQNQTSERILRIKTLEVKGDGDKSLIVFDSPKDVKGTAFLSYSHATSPDDQWLYLPALKRVKRISTSNKSGPFMGSEFAYEDLSSQEVEKYTYKYLESETVASSKGHVIERYPVDDNSGYSRQIVWVDEPHWRIHKIEYYDRKGELLKTLTYHDYKRYSNDKWRADKMLMVNHQSGKKTTLTWSNIKFNQPGVTERKFSTTGLKRAR